MADAKTSILGALESALYRIFTAVARVTLKRGLPYDAVAEVAKRAFIDVAYREFTIPGRKQSASRVSVLTGIHRKEIARVLAAPDPDDRETSTRVTCAAAVVAGWRRDRAFADRRGSPAVLPFDGATVSFTELVRLYGRGDTPARAVLDELLRVGTVERRADGRIELTVPAYLPEKTSPEALSILGTDVSDLIAVIDHNLGSAPGEGFFQRKVSYDNLPAEAVAEIRARVEDEGQALLERLDEAMSLLDRDSNPKASGSGRKRAMLGIYYFEEDATED
jgi:hypothetical protein